MTMAVGTNPKTSRLRRALQGPTVQVTARLLAGIGGGYALTYLSIAAMALWLPWSRPEVTLYATAGSFLLYVGAILYAFGERSLGRLWGILAVLLALLSVLVWQGLP